MSGQYCDCIETVDGFLSPLCGAKKEGCSDPVRFDRAALWCAQNELVSLRAEVEALKQERHKNERVNFELTYEGVRLCRGHHHRSADCEWEYYVPAESRGAAVAAEREACAKVCEETPLAWPSTGREQREACAAAIRARGEQ